jgi:hypothetical protein
MKSDTVVYIPSDDDASDRWLIVAAALRAAGYRNLRPAPMPSLAFQPRHRRQRLAAASMGA